MLNTDTNLNHSVRNKQKARSPLEETLNKISREVTQPKSHIENNDETQPKSLAEVQEGGPQIDHQHRPDRSQQTVDSQHLPSVCH